MTDSIAVHPDGLAALVERLDVLADRLIAMALRCTNSIGRC